VELATKDLYAWPRSARSTTANRRSLVDCWSTRVNSSTINSTPSLAASEKRGIGDLDLSFVTDGLRAEREQGITIDVAYRYATTPTRKFIIADCPGHVRYTRNMATGASTADLALVVIDVASGLKEQTRRHLCIAALLGVRSIIVAVNKMDTVAGPTWPSKAWWISSRPSRANSASPPRWPSRSRRCSVTTWPPPPPTPLVRRTVGARRPRSLRGGIVGDRPRARLPIQWVLRQPGGGRTYAGMVSGEAFHVGDKVTLLPQNIETTIRAINFGGESRLSEAVGWPRTSTSTTRPTRDAATSSRRTRCPR
jgi:hypothetical protein